MHQYLIHHLLENSTYWYPDRTALIFKERSLTYAELHQRSNQFALALSYHGVGRGDRVGLMLNKSIESIIAIFGILKAGAAYVPVDPLTPEVKVKYIINNCSVKLLVTSGEGKEDVIRGLGIESSLEKVILVDGDAQILAKECEKPEVIPWKSLYHNKPNESPLVNIPDTSTAYILHTSGSTGLPKGVVISHLNSLAFVNMASDFFGINEEDRLSSHAPFHFDLSVFDLFVAVKSGAAIVLVPEIISLFPIKLAQFIDDMKISVWNSVASVISLLAERGKLEKFHFDSLRLVLFSGEVLPVKFLRKAMTHMRSADFVNVYGQTEANSSIFYRVDGIPDDDAWRIPIGRAFPNFDVFALDDRGNVITSPGEVGELFVNSSSVAMGYFGDTEKTSKTFVQDPRSLLVQNKIYRTGDLVTIDKNCDYVFLGRKDHQVKSRGYRIQLDEIEFILNGHSEIKEAIVIAIPDELIGNRLVSFVCPADGVKLSDLDISDYCSSLLPAYMVPDRINFIDSMPKTTTGKPDRKLLTKIACEP